MHRALLVSIRAEELLVKSDSVLPDMPPTQWFLARDSMLCPINVEG